MAVYRSMKTLFFKFIEWLLSLFYFLVKKKKVEEQAKDDSKKIEESDDHIKDEELDIKERKDDDVFNNKNW